MSEDTWQEWSGAADEAFNLTMEDIEYLYTLSPLTFESYYQLRRLVTHRGFPAHPAEFLMPMTLKNLDIAACAALVEELRERRISGTLPETMFDMHRLVEGCLPLHTFLKCTDCCIQTDHISLNCSRRQLLQ